VGSEMCIRDRRADVVEEDLVAVQKLKDNSNVPRDGECPQPS